MYYNIRMNPRIQGDLAAKRVHLFPHYERPAISKDVFMRVANFGRPFNERVGKNM